MAYCSPLPYVANYIGWGVASQGLGEIQAAVRGDPGAKPWRARGQFQSEVGCRHEYVGDAWSSCASTVSAVS